ncbi:putative lipoprotein [Leptospira interrogans serovar Grippotyphosa str. UI 12769]|uniref:Putative lipoprotein n=3 Tax=Leptospira interrogans TaxID=173 RepID=A0A0E2D4S7_LEPIR|nr:putative lipoprotein [Leptospira interrogans serovar Pomona str. Kennewicki LC82-25]EKO71187.1 putative lipoprotein [Leptospira interrogans serovar Canicola str. Fiocruz LV133]EKR26902.1 putative lipoprotein [Leptospira interrogans serovar Bataviae str. L1111]EKR46019.1 putative lipoprotein [Leptospira interrogans serovar Grippotyphosa str. UI 08368]EKR55023.1 putative lipoprotein [Leptospira interrogans str. UI 12758]EMK19067.1 putative lipoprotein [Leptospira interrogans str. Kito]EMN875
MAIQNKFYIFAKFYCSFSIASSCFLVVNQDLFQRRFLEPVSKILKSIAFQTNQMW